MSDYEEEYVNKSFNIKVWFKLKHFFLPYMKKMFGIVVFMLLIAFFDVMMPLFQRYAVDSFITSKTTEGLGRFVAVYASVLIIQSLIVIIFVRLAIVVEMRIGFDLREAIFKHLQKLSLSYYNTTPVGYIMSRVLSDTNKIGSMIAWGLVDVFWSVTYVTGVFLAMIALNPKLAIIVITIVPVMAVVTFYFQKKLLETNRKIRKINSNCAWKT